MSKSLADKLKAKITGTVAASAPKVDAKPIPPKEKKGGFPPKSKDAPILMRACCATQKGKKVPHAAGCISLKKKEPRKGKWALLCDNLPNRRWPNGTTMEKLWDGVAWRCTVKVPGGYTHTCHAKNSFGSEQAVTVRYGQFLRGESHE